MYEVRGGSRTGDDLERARFGAQLVAEGDGGEARAGLPQCLRQRFKILRLRELRQRRPDCLRQL